jgi:hydroxymethylpyrimidine pyrophosphatase-like HAD family hydrolase
MKQKLEFAQSTVNLRPNKVLVLNPNAFLVPHLRKGSQETLSDDIVKAAIAYQAVSGKLVLLTDRTFQGAIKIARQLHIHVHSGYIICDNGTSVYDLKADNPAANIIMESNPPSKVHGLKMVCVKLGLGPSDVLAIGHGEEDIEVLQWAGWGICMPSSTDKVKASCEETSLLDGVGAIAEQLKVAFSKLIETKESEM